MKKSNLSEIRRVRHEMSKQAGHDVRKLIDMLSPLRDRVRARLVDHGGETEQRDAHGVADRGAASGESSPSAG